MKVTKYEAQPTLRGIGGLLQKNSAEHEGYAGVCNSTRIAENTTTNANEQRLLEQILNRNNLNQMGKAPSIGHTNRNRQVNPTGNSTSIKSDIRATVPQQQLRIQTQTRMPRRNQTMPRLYQPRLQIRSRYGFGEILRHSKPKQTHRGFEPHNHRWAGNFAHP